MSFLWFNWSLAKSNTPVEWHRPSKTRVNIQSPCFTSVHWSNVANQQGPVTLCVRSHSAHVPHSTQLLLSWILTSHTNIKFYSLHYYIPFFANNKRSIVGQARRQSNYRGSISMNLWLLLGSATSQILLY